MKKALLFNVILLFFVIKSSLAQYLHPVQYFKNNGRQVSSIDSADYTRAITSPDSGSVLYNVAEYYKDGKYRFKGKTSNYPSLKLQGEGISYFPNGSKKVQTEYKDGQPVNQRYYYYPDGKEYLIVQYNDAQDLKPFKMYEKPFTVIANYDKAGKTLVINGNGYYKEYDDRFEYIVEEGAVKNGRRDGAWKAHTDSNRTHLTEVYNNGKLVSGKALYKDGNTSTYAEVREVAPEYKGGLKTLYIRINRDIKYPKYALQNEIQGRVTLSFIIEKDGTLTNIKVLSSPHAVLSQEAIRVLQLNTDWMPGTKYGQNVKVVFTLPVIFRLE